MIQGELLIGNVDRRNEFGNRRWLLRGGERYRHCTDRYGKSEGEAAKHGISLFWPGTLWEAHGYIDARPMRRQHNAAPARCNRSGAGTFGDRKSTRLNSSH